MKIIKISKAGEIMNQPHGKNPSGKLDSQIFLEKEDPQKTKKKKNKSKEDKSCSICTAKRKSKEEFEYNPWAVCTESVGREDEDKYERCVKKVKKKEREKLNKKDKK